MGFTITAIVIAVLAGVGAFYSWDRNKALSAGLAVVTLLAGAAGTIGAFAATLSLAFRLLPLIFVVLGVWLVYRYFKSRRQEKETLVNQ